MKQRLIGMGIIKKDKHPYEYVTPENFETVKGVLTMGMNGSKTPKEIAEQLSQSTGIPMPAAYGIVQAEFLESMKEMNKKNDNS